MRIDAVEWKLDGESLVMDVPAGADVRPEKDEEVRWIRTRWEYTVIARQLPLPLLGWKMAVVCNGELSYSGEFSCYGEMQATIGGIVYRCEMVRQFIHVPPSVTT